MEDVYPRLWIGNDQDYVKVHDAVVTGDRKDWAFVRACKDGPGGHRQMLGYTTRGAPQGPNYYAAWKDNHIALNLIDTDDPSHVHDESIDPALEFIGKFLSEGYNVLVACNAGRSRGPSITMMYLGMIHDLPRNFREAFRVFKILYPKYDPGQGMEFYVKHHYASLVKE